MQYCYKIVPLSSLSDDGFTGFFANGEESTFLFLYSNKNTENRLDKSFYKKIIDDIIFLSSTSDEPHVLTKFVLEKLEEREPYDNEFEWSIRLDTSSQMLVAKENILYADKLEDDEIEWSKCDNM